MREASGTSPGVVSLPSGGGGVSSLGDRFQPDLVRGTGNYAVPLNLPKGPNELRPGLQLTYSTGFGNGPFGVGWQLNVSRIERRTDRGVPSYTDEDTFVLGGEILVPVGGNRYRPKTDGQFWMIERIGDSWRVRTGDGRVMLFGQAIGSRETNGPNTFAWYLDEEQDAAGNSVLYFYRRDGNQLYLQEMRYSIFRLAVVYENRADVQRNGRAGYLRTTALRSARLELHCGRLAPSLMRTWTLTYGQAANGAALLARVRLSATEAGVTERFPDLTFTYSTLDLTKWAVHEMRSLIPPPSLEAAGTQLVDLTGDGLPDVLQTMGGRTYLWRNRGDGWFEGPAAIPGLPAVLGLERSSVGLADLDGNGRVELFAADQPLQLAFESNGRGGFRAEPIVFRSRPHLRLAEGDTRLMDADGDGVTDLLETARTNMLIFSHSPGVGWQEPQVIQRIHDLDQFPDVAFGQRGVRLADMTGDGLQDMVLIESGNVSYWPYLGNGHWGARVGIQSSPVLPPGYRDERLYIMDVDGDGCSDLVYVDFDSILIWLNQSGSRFGAPVELPLAPAGAARPFIVDFFGDGRPGLAWDSVATSADSAGYRFLRLAEGRARYLMTRVNNGMGGLCDIEYSNSTLMRQQDNARGRLWLGELPFVVRVVSSINERETVTGRTTRLTMQYSDGVYDGIERHFRGFSRVTVGMSGDESVPATLQEVTFFQGDPQHENFVERRRQRALAGTLLATKTYEQTASGLVLRTESTQTWDLRLEHEGEESIYFPFVTRIETRERSSSGAPARIERTDVTNFDAFGNPRRRARASFGEGDPPAQWIQSEERFTYVNDVARWLVRLPARSELRDPAGAIQAVQIRYYDGAAFSGAVEGSAARGLVTRTIELRMAESRLPAGYAGASDFTALGYTLTGTGDTRGWYAATSSVRRDAFGNVVEQRDPTGIPVRIEFDADGVFPLRVIDARGHITTLTFNVRSCEPALTQFADGRTVRNQYDPIGRLTATFETDDAGNEQLVKCWVQDQSRLPVSVTSIAPLSGGRTTAEFAPGTDFAALNGVSIGRVFYDGFGKQILQLATAPDSDTGTRRFAESERVQLNPKGLVKVQHAARFVADLAWTPMPALTAAAVRQRYDFNGNVVETGGPGPVHFRVVRDNFTIHHYEGPAAGAYGAAVLPGPPARIERYDARGRLVRIEEAKGDGTWIATSYRLTLDGRIAAVVDDAGVEITRYEFAGIAEPLRITNRDAGTRSYYRDAGGKVIERVDADGSQLFHAYDTLGRLVRMEHQRPAQARETIREMFYDADPSAPSAGRFLDGRIALLRESGNEMRYSYDRTGKTVREDIATDGVTLTTQRSYSLQGNLTSITYPDGRRIDYVVDSSGSVREIPGIAGQVRYGPDGVLESYRLVNGVDVAMPRDPASLRLTSISASLGGATLRRVDYTYDTVGQFATTLDEIPGNVEFHQFTYDGLYRLTGYQTRANNAAGGLLRSGSYSYDANGNLLNFGDTQPLVYAYGDAAHRDRLTTVTNGPLSQSVGYNACGHMQSFGNLASMTYDAHDRLVSVGLADGVRLAIAYDAQSRRIVKRITRGAATTVVRYATGLYEQHASHSVRHIFLDKMLLASERVAGATVTPVFYMSDHHGTILMAMNNLGTVITNQRYTPFGMARNGSDTLDRYLGRERDIETGLQHLGARYYAAGLGRFVSADWWILENPTKPARMPQAYNVYSYALNNPLTFKDPSGMFFFIAGIIAAIVITAAIATAAAFTVGFIAGLVYGLANGQGWDSLLTALETALTTTIGMWLGGVTGFIVGGPVGMVIGAIMGGMNGLISGMTGIYNWKSIDGWLAFLSDSTWGLIGTSLGNIVHIINLFWPDSNYRSDLSHRQNRHVYEGGFALKGNFAFTQGNVISNAGLGSGSVNASFIANHEELHIWQSRIFGPLFQVTYVAWAVGGFLVATVYWFFNTDENWGSLVETAAYYDNPFEYWAYNNDSNWPPSGVNSDLAWG